MIGDFPVSAATYEMLFFDQDWGAIPALSKPVATAHEVAVAMEEWNQWCQRTERFPRHSLSHYRNVFGVSIEVHYVGKEEEKDANPKLPKGRRKRTPGRSSGAHEVPDPNGGPDASIRRDDAGKAGGETDDPSDRGTLGYEA